MPREGVSCLFVEGMMKKADMITAIVLLVFSGFVLYKSWLLPASLTLGPGPAFLPGWLGVFMGILASILLVGAVTAPAESGGGSPWPGKKEGYAVFLVLAGLIAFALALQTIGFLISTFVFVTYLMRLTQKETWSKAVLVALCTTAGLYLVFQILLGIPLPKTDFQF